MELDFSVSFAEQYSVNSTEYAEVDASTMSLPVRITNRLKSNGIISVADLLNCSPQRIMEIRGMGKLCVEQIETFVREISGRQVSTPKAVCPPQQNTYLIENRDAILNGDFSFVEELTVPALREQGEMYRDGYNYLGSDLVRCCVYEHEKVVPIIRALTFFCEENARSIVIHDLLRSLPHYRRENTALGYINAYTQDEDKRCKLIAAYVSEEATLQMINESILSDDELYFMLKKFLSWCNFNIQEDISKICNAVFKNPRMKIALSMRARNNTLEKAGNRLNVTRERVRQIEAKAFKIFTTHQNRLHLIAKISADKDGDAFITSADVEKYSEEYGTELLYLMKNCNTSSFTYDSQLDAFIVGDDSLHSKVFAFIENLPDFFNADKLSSILEEASEECDLPEQLVRNGISESYKLTGEVYHRSRLSLANIYSEILKKYYPNGIRAYDPEEIARFRNHIHEDYGEVKVPHNNRALTARIAGICILCGRGMYKLKQKEYIPKALSQKIYKYIQESDDSIFLMNTLFSIFEEDLRCAGVDNKYYLQGILHETFGDRLFFSRDYVSKDGEATSIYSLVVDFIHNSRIPVTKNQIQEKFPGISDIVVNFSVADANVLNYFGEYFHASRLNISAEDERYLKGVIDKVLSDGASHHIKDVYEKISGQKPEIFTRNYALYPFCAFSIIEYLFREQYQFSRPYIAPHGSEIGRAAERLHDYLYSQDEFLFSDIGEFCKENHYMIQSQLEYVNSCNDQYLIYDEEKVLSIARVGVTGKIANEVETAIAGCVSETMPIRDLTCWSHFPKINVPWTEWLVYSVLTKWGSIMDAAASNNQFRLAIPLVAPAGLMDTAPFVDAFKSVSQPHADEVIVKVDDLDNIDEILSSMLGDDLLEDSLWD